MNSRVLLVLLFLAVVGTTWLLVTLVRLPPPEGVERAAPDTAAVVDRKAVVNPFTRGVPVTEEDSLDAENAAADPDTVRVPPDTAASEGARP